MNTLDRIKNILKSHENEIKENYSVKEIGIFGSYLRNEQNINSDLDVLVEFDRTPGLIKFLELEEYLTDLLKIKVDLVMKTSLKPSIGKRILNEVEYV